MAVPDILAKILATKRAEVAAGLAKTTLAQMEARASAADPPRGFVAALRARIAGGQPAVIAEVKRASPSRGMIAADFDPARVAASYARHGAACLSVLTDREYFSGSDADLVAARAVCALPVLRKDFVVDRWQVAEARALGADCILLIVAALAPAELVALEDYAVALGLDVLVESHDAAELDQALALRTPLIGINNRNLRTFETRLGTTWELKDRVPAGRIVVTESGISSPGDVEAMRQRGIPAFLVGSAFMAAPDPGVELARVFPTL